jgi:integrase
MKLSEIYRWYEQLEIVTSKKQSLNTLRIIRKYLERLGDPNIKKLTIQTVSKDRLNRVKSCKPTTSNAEVSHLRAMLAEALLNGLIKSNPIRDIKLLPCNNVRDVSLRPADVTRLVSHAPEWLGKLITIAAHMPMRRSEIILLEWRDVDFDIGDNGVLRIRPEIAKNKKARSIPLHPQVRKLLSRLPSRFIAGFVFPHQSLIRKSFDYQFRLARKAAGLDCTYHDIRHLCISEMFRAGIPQATIMRLSGHNSDSMFQRYFYQHEDELVNLKWG